jgi:hypothetical protein
MARSTDTDSIASSINRAAEFPDDTGGASSPLPGLFTGFPIPDGERIVTDTPPRQPQGQTEDLIPGVPRYDKLQTHLRRFIIGQRMIGDDDRGRPSYVDQDDSQAYEALMNDILHAKAMLRWEEKQHLRDGTLVVSVCYFTRTERPSQPTTDEPPLSGVSAT